MQWTGRVKVTQEPSANNLKKNIKMIYISRALLIYLVQKLSIAYIKCHF